MHKVEAIIRPYLLDAVREAFQQIDLHDFTIVECKGTGQPDIAHRFRGSQYSHGLTPRILIFAVVTSERLEETLDALQNAAYTGEVGDGKIFVSPIEEVVRVRTKERGKPALA